MACSLQNEQPGPPPNDLVCKPHGKEAVFACKQCVDELCCEDCVVTTHQCHPFKKISVLMAEKREIIANYIKVLEEQKIPMLQKQMAAAQQKLAKTEKNSGDTRRAVQERSTQLKAELDKVLNRNVRRCEEMAFENESKLMVYKEHMENILTEYRQKLNKVQQVIDEGSIEEIIHTKNNLPKPPVYPQYPDITLPSFTPGDPTQLREAFGSIIIRPSESDETTRDSNPASVAREIEDID
ncbi:tripartite motif-containing protein 45-like [Pecten maximus]|uniref:tripartite motif-containing protein 45-like n=1 Tax=Pecten maximus TaxID=6579 RepID=UPI0014584A6C|nr:tripartite motif-containing protein 45-like [Pecten maximus]